MEPRYAQEVHTHSDLTAVRADDDTFMWWEPTASASPAVGIASPSTNSYQAPSTSGTALQMSPRRLRQPSGTSGSTFGEWRASQDARHFLGGMDFKIQFGGELLNETALYDKRIWCGFRNSVDNVALHSGLGSEKAFDGFGFGVEGCIPVDRPAEVTVTQVLTWGNIGAANIVQNSDGTVDFNVTSRSGTIYSLYGVVAYANGWASVLMRVTLIGSGMTGGR